MKPGIPNLRRLWPWTAALLAVAVVMVLPSFAAAQQAPQDQYQVFLEGTHCLRRIFFEMGFTPLTKFDEAEKEPEKTVVVILGPADRRLLLPQALAQFVCNGGAVMVAAYAPDRNFEDFLEDVAGVRIRTEEGPDAIGDDQLSFYQGRSYCPFLTPAREPRIPASETKLAQALFRDPRKDDRLHVALNHPAFLYRFSRTRPAGDVSQVANAPRFFPRGDAHGQAPPALLRMVGGNYENGRFLVLADHRSLLNRMMLLKDTGNVEFAQNCLAWLQDRGKAEPRTKLLFIRAGAILSDFDVKLRDGPNWLQLLLMGWTALSESAPALQNKIAEVEESGRLGRRVNRFLEDKGITPKKVQDHLFVAAAGLLFFYGMFRVIGPGRTRPETAPPSLSRKVAEQLPTTPLIEGRRRALLESGNLGEEARALVRSVFLAAGVAPGGLPTVKTRGGLWQRWQSRRRALRLWQLAYGTTPPSVPVDEWVGIERELNALKADVDCGNVRFA